jgi:hypothetical protein
MLIGCLYELIDKHGVNYRVVIQHKDEFGASLERMADAKVVASRIAEIPSRVEDIDASVL